MGRHRREIQLGEAPNIPRPWPPSQLSPLKSLCASLNEQTININLFLREVKLRHREATQAEQMIDIGSRRIQIRSKGWEIWTQHSVQIA